MSEGVKWPEHGIRASRLNGRLTEFAIDPIEEQQVLDNRVGVRLNPVKRKPKKAAPEQTRWIP